MTENIYNVSLSKIRNRRIKVFGLMFLSTFLATLKWTASIPTDANIITKFLMISLFILTFAWIALFFWSSIFGFIGLLKKSKIPGIKWLPYNTKLSSKTAILMPVYNESPRTVFANLLAMLESLSKTGQGESFDVFVLSDTTNPKVWLEEEKTFLEAQKLVPGEINIYYRKRGKNIARKSGNIEDFCTKWGAKYDFMVVLDADSMIEGETFVKMAQLMEANPKAGIIQAPPVSVNRNTLFARLQQFAGAVYGPIVASGLSYWQVGDSNYWGHNAIIRVKAFIDCCGLPVLKGPKPFGGHILSHDFVEAALIRRGGWSAWLLPELGGSYEECPPSIIDFAGRDRRWCQGNMQHIKVLISKGFHPISRVHFTIGIMSYLSSPIWLCFLLVGLAIALSKFFFPPIYFPVTYTLFPDWPIFDKLGTIALFILSMSMLIFPKFLGLFIYMKKNPKIGKRNAIKSVLIEIVYSALQAPIMMMFQSKAVLDIFKGKDSGWNTQNRGDDETCFRDAFARHIWHTILGILTTIVVLLYASTLFWWMLPITLGLMLSIPISILSSKLSLGLWSKKHNLFLVPEELNLPSIFKRSTHFEKQLTKILPEAFGVELVIDDKLFNALHIYMLAYNGPVPDLPNSALTQAQIKLDSYITHGAPMCLSKEEELSLLYNAKVLEDANIAKFLG